MALKRVSWIGSSHKDYTGFHERVQSRMGFSLYLAQTGELADHAKPVKGFGGAGVIELFEDHDGSS